MRKRHLLSLIMCFVGGLWSGGLILFVTTVHDYVEPEINSSLLVTDAIVVLTGGSDRVTTGFDLLIAHKGKKLFISGVHPGLALEQLPKSNVVPKALRDCCISLGHAAGDTIGNAEETASWIRDEKFRSLRLVTSHYHMPRSMLLFQQALPDIAIIPHPVAAENVVLTDWWLRLGTSTLLVNEYNKYILAIAQRIIGEWLMQHGDLL